MSEWFHAYYATDWGTAEAARKARDDERRSVVSGSGPQGVVKGTVRHPVFGVGYELWFKRGLGDAVSDLRILPQWDRSTGRRVEIPQGPPSLEQVEEVWETMPFGWNGSMTNGGYVS